MERKAVLRVACVPLIAAALLPPVLSRFMKQHPNVISHIETCSHAGIIDRLIRRQSDIGFALASTPSAVIVEEALVSGTGVCVAPRARFSEKKKDVTLNDLSRHQLPRRLSRVRAALRACGRDPCVRPACCARTASSGGRRRTRLLDNPMRLARGLLHKPARVHPEDVPGKQAPAPSAGFHAPSGLRAAPRHPQAAAEPLSPRRSQLPPSRLQGRELKGPTLAELMAPERHQAQAARTQRDQLLHAALPDGGSVMKRLVERAARRHPATMAEMWHARTTGSPKPMEGQRRQDFEALVRADVGALAAAGGMHPMEAAHTMRLALADGSLGSRILPEDRQLLNEVLDALVNPTEGLYQKMNLRLTSDTWPAFTDAQVLEKPEPLGSGKFNTVFSVKLAEADGRPFEGVFKPLNTSETGWVAGVSGIPRDDPQIAMRNMATVAYAKKLGLDVIADTRMAMIAVEGDRLEPQLGMVMERAQGTPAARVDSATLSRADVAAEVTKLQLLDHLTGQGDRHANNYFIDIGRDGRPKVTGIDNDQCFGSEMHDPAGIQQIPDDKWQRGFRGTGLPPVVDTEMERSINALTKQDITQMLGDKLSEDEIEAALDRHEGVKQHIAQLRADGMIIEPTQWGDMDVQFLLTPENSYVGRDRDRAQRIEAKRAEQEAAAANDNW